MTNQIPLTFNKTYCPRTKKTWYEIKNYVKTTQERIESFWEDEIKIWNFDTHWRKMIIQQKLENLDLEKIILEHLAFH